MRNLPDDGLFLTLREADEEWINEIHWLCNPIDFSDIPYDRNSRRCDGCGAYQRSG